MFKRLRIGIAVIAAGLITSGCVCLKEFKEMETQKNDEISALQQRVGSLQGQKTSLVKTSQQQKQEYDALAKKLSSEVEKGKIQVRQYQDMMTVELGEQIFFEPGRATLKAESKEVVKKVGEALKGKGYENKIIRVVGHTDNAPVDKSLQGTFATNWELSLYRAAEVIRVLQEVGVPPERMIAAGRGEYNPVASNDTPEGRLKNRRIQIMLLDKSLFGEMSQRAK